MIRVSIRAAMIAGVMPMLAMPSAAAQAGQTGGQATEAGEADPAAPKASEERGDIFITGVRQAYRGDFTLKEIPQSVAVIDGKTLQEANILRLTDALDLNASVARQNTLGGLWDGFAVRGFAGDENLPTGYLVNGFNGGRGFAGQRDVSGIERIEVLKGPAAALFGRGEPGGTINIVTKQAQLGETFGTTSLQVGSFDRVRADADVNVAVAGTLTARVIGYAESAGSFRDTIDEKRWGFLPSIGLGIGDSTRLTYDFEWTRVETPFDRGIVVLNGDFDTVPRNRFLGEPGDGDHVARATGHQLRVQHDFSDRWSLLVGASYRETLLTGSSSDAELVPSRQKLFTDGRSLSRQRRSRRYDSDHFAIRAELAGDFELGGMRHRVLIGADHDEFNNDQDFRRFRPPVLTPTTTDRAGNIIDILDPVYGRFPLPTPAPLNNRLDTQKATGIYIQDHISLTDRLQVRFGGRFDDFVLRTDNRITSVLSQRSDQRFSPQAGIVYALADALSLYAAYGEGFRANIGTDVSGVIFDPETSKSIEIGGKFSLLGGRLAGTLSVFQLDKDNVLASDTSNPGFSVAIGKARSRGVEFDATGRLPGGIDVLVSYAHVDAESRSTLLDPNFSFQIRPGDPLINIPGDTLSVLATKAFDVGGRQASIGAAVQYVGDRSGATGTDFRLPSHTLARVFGQVEVIEGVELFGEIRNLFDERWYANSYAALWVQPGAPRTGAVGVRTRF
ncbi:TonB-dependent siderophore receptor [Sphingomonas sp. 37zxx]|uniref:TonB-dependent siderophore receptor n=1 Tax=Sphingomonas sp. 37zxx TaxID=1550073 RepID=UPI00053BE855|nr:TonB-dependent siderophore receptor [Sphingomonas sp. 37zxx]